MYILRELFKSFAYYLIKFLFLNFSCFLFILDIIPLFMIFECLLPFHWFHRNIFHIFAHYFLCCTQGFKFDVVPLAYFCLFFSCAFGIMSKKSFSNPMSWNLPPHPPARHMFSFRSSVVSVQFHKLAIIIIYFLYFHQYTEES